MNLTQLKRLMQAKIQEFYPTATVVFGKTNLPKPHLPFITLEFGNVSRPLKPDSTWNDEGVLIGTYPSKVVLTVNLFTKGTEISDVAGFTYRENNSVQDLIMLGNYIESEDCIQWLYSNDLSMRMESPVVDVTEIINDDNNQFRAMAQFTIMYTDVAQGTTGIVIHEPTDIGGSEEIADRDVGYFTEVEVELEEKEDDD